jgi:hypothetical protein
MIGVVNGVIADRELVRCECELPVRRGMLISATAGELPGAPTVAPPPR